jgi:hypothetical protein
LLIGIHAFFTDADAQERDGSAAVPFLIVLAAAVLAPSRKALPGRL